MTTDVSAALQLVQCGGGRLHSSQCPGKRTHPPCQNPQGNEAAAARCCKLRHQQLRPQRCLATAQRSSCYHPSECSESPFQCSLQHALFDLLSVSTSTLPPLLQLQRNPDCHSCVLLSLLYNQSLIFSSSDFLSSSLSLCRFHFPRPSLLLPSASLAPTACCLHHSWAHQSDRSRAACRNARSPSHALPILLFQSPLPLSSSAPLHPS